MNFVRLCKLAAIEYEAHLHDYRD
ncbi:hypothetical protein [Providencia burhodogranariea]